MRDTIKGAVIGAVVAAGVSVLLAQTPTWSTPRTWATDDLLTATQFNAQFRDNLLWLRQDAQLTGTPALLDLGCGTLGTNEVLFSDCTWATIPDQTPANDSITTVKLADDAVTQPKIANDAVGVAQLHLSSGTMSWMGSAIFFDIDRYAYLPRSSTGTSDQSRCRIDPRSNTIASTTSSRVSGSMTTGTDTCTANWDYVAASDNPSVWAVTRDTDGAVVALRESEDVTADQPVSVPYDDNDNPLPGYTVIDVGLPSLAVIELVYATLTATERTVALRSTGDYVTGRGWLESFATLADLSSIETRYEPSGRQWAMRCAANAAVGVSGCHDAPVTTFYLGALVVSSGVWAVAP